MSLLPWRALVATLALLHSGCASSFLMRPTTAPIEPRGTEHRLLKTGMGELEIFLQRSSEEPELFVLEFTGRLGRAERGTMLPPEVLASCPLEVWVTNFPGYGSSSGRARLSAIAPAADAAYSALARRAAGRPIVVAGFSLGATTSLHLAARRPVAGALLKNVAPLARTLLSRHGWWNLWLLASLVAAQVPRDLDCRRNAARSEAPAYFVVSGEDEVIPRRLSRQVIEAYRGPHQVSLVEGALHGDPIPPSLTNQLTSWLRDRAGVPGARAPRPGEVAER